MTFAFPQLKISHERFERQLLLFSPIDFTNPINSNFVGIGVVKAPTGKHCLGKIHLNGNRWSALNVDDDTIPIGSKIKVIGRRDLTLYVKAAQYT